MSLSPAEIRHAELRRGLFGYRQTTVAATRATRRHARAADVTGFSPG